MLNSVKAHSDETIYVWNLVKLTVITAFASKFGQVDVFTNCGKESNLFFITSLIF